MEVLGSGTKRAAALTLLAPFTTKLLRGKGGAPCPDMLAAKRCIIYEKKMEQASGQRNIGP